MDQTARIQTLLNKIKITISDIEIILLDTNKAKKALVPLEKQKVWSEPEPWQTQLKKDQA